MKRILFLIVIIISFSCKKEVNQIDNFNGTRYFLSSSISNPIVSNGILCFQDVEHFDNYYNYLDSLCNSLDLVLDDFDLDSFLLVQESNYSEFISLRSIFSDETEELSNLEEYFSIVYSHDDIKNSILNSDGVVKIGNYYYVLFGPSSYYKIPDNESSLLNVLSNYSKEEFKFVPEVYAVQGVEIISDIKYAKGTSDQYEDYVYPTAHVQFFSCNPYRKALIYEIRAVGNAHWTGNYPVEWTINWGDGTSTNTSTSEFGIIEHVYSTQDDFVITIRSRYADWNNPGDFLEDVFTLNTETYNECSFGYIEDFKTLFTQDNNYSMLAFFSFEPIMTHRENGKNKGKFRAITRCYKFKSSVGKYKKYRANCSVEMDYTFRSEYCALSDSGNESKSKRRKKLRVRAKNKGTSVLKDFFSIQNGENTSQHTAQLPSGTLTCTLKLDPCN